MGFHKPSQQERHSVAQYLDNHSPVKPKEALYVRHREDLVTLRPGREHAWLDRTIESCLHSVQEPLPLVHVRCDLRLL